MVKKMSETIFEKCREIIKIRIAKLSDKSTIEDYQNTMTDILMCLGFQEGFDDVKKVE